MVKRINLFLLSSIDDDLFENFGESKRTNLYLKDELHKDKPQILVTSKSQIVEQIIDKADDKEPGNWSNNGAEFKRL